MPIRVQSNGFVAGREQVKTKTPDKTSQKSNNFQDGDSFAIDATTPVGIIDAKPIQ
ncbi:hypothetical protein PAMC26577_05950 [Caballeronia sordidicola]|uniref:Uncharacterized protein n=1 Tax=Caballeronia sordidicola TaxID=196367 RepID=A0A242N3C5_CABSO|nr:hypothetical protein PAMC26577_05950 [Caballeronia sordidicola]